MKAMVFHRYGSPDVLHLEAVAQPAPREDEALIQIHAAGVNAADWRLLRAKPFLVRIMGNGLFKPKQTILGSDLSGRVTVVGRNVTEFQPGDDVFGYIPGHACGGFAEYAAVPAHALVLKPARLTFEEAAAVPMAAMTALVGLRDTGRIQPGQKVLIIGASGGVGTFAVQIARSFGAEVTAVCSAKNLDQARSLGADRVIDYAREDFTRDARRYDLILAVNGYHPISAYRYALRPRGIYVMVGGSSRQIFESLLLGPVLSMRRDQTLGALTYTPHKKELVFLKDLLEAGTIHSVIDRSFPLRETAEAIRYVEAGHARGKVVITVAAAY